MELGEEMERIERQPGAIPRRRSFPVPTSTSFAPSKRVFVQKKFQVDILSASLAADGEVKARDTEGEVSDETTQTSHTESQIPGEAAGLVGIVDDALDKTGE